MPIHASHNPLSMVIEAANDLWPDISAKVVWVSGIDPGEGGEEAYGRTTYPDDGSEPIIDIRADLTVEVACEILAHEIAHVKAGADEEHGPEWERAFDQLHNAYAARVDALYAAVE